jgi:hypothetical protein
MYKPKTKIPKSPSNRYSKKPNNNPPSRSRLLTKLSPAAIDALPLPNPLLELVILTAPIQTIVAPTHALLPAVDDHTYVVVLFGEGAVEALDRDMPKERYDV